MQLHGILLLWSLNYKNMYKKNIKNLQKNQGFSGVHLSGLSFITFLAAVMVVLVVAMLKSNLERIPNSIPPCRVGPLARV